jgi:CRISPR-associated endonuclease Cas3-HD
MPQSWIGRWPGKSPVVPGGFCHPAAYHMLDVAAVAERLATPFPFPNPQAQALVLLVALHDLGKIGAQFRGMSLGGLAQQGGSHWRVTEALLRHHDARLAPILGMRDRHRFALYAATAGHHGRPPEGWTGMLRLAGAEAIADAGVAIDALAALWPEASLAGLSREDVYRLSWWLPGLVAAADWIGSNALWFPPTEADLSLTDYLDLARSRAGTAVAAAGLASPAVSGARLFSFALRPMQEACAAVPLRDGPMLALIEDETGTGKTEAALILAQRMMAARKGRGIFFALPTMATADAMFARARDVVGAMFTAGPSLTLAHGRAGRPNLPLAGSGLKCDHAEVAVTRHRLRAGRNRVDHDGPQAGDVARFGQGDDVAEAGPEAGVGGRREIRRGGKLARFRRHFECGEAGAALGGCGPEGGVDGRARLAGRAVSVAVIRLRGRRRQRRKRGGQPAARRLGIRRLKDRRCRRGGTILADVLGEEALEALDGFGGGGEATEGKLREGFGQLRDLGAGERGLHGLPLSGVLDVGGAALSGDRVDHRAAVAEAGGEGFGLIDPVEPGADAGCGLRPAAGNEMVGVGEAEDLVAGGLGGAAGGHRWAPFRAADALRQGRGPETATANTRKRWSKRPAWGSRSGNTQPIAG